MKNKIIYSPYTFILFFIWLSLEGCIEPYDSNFGQDNKVLVVEGLLSNDYKNPDTIKIQYSFYSNEYVVRKPIDGTQASLLSSSGQEVKLVSVGTNGGFLPPPTFRINIAEKYTLKFTLGNGQSYESTSQQMLPTPPIDKIYDIFNPTSRLSNDGKVKLSANEIYVDFQDTPNQKNNYLWRYIHYERLPYCITCEANSKYKAFTESCVKNTQAFDRNPEYDYQCRGSCYSILPGSRVNILSDIASDGRLIKGQLIAKIPMYGYYGCLVVIDQMSISPEIFNFNKILESQSQATGGLADTPAAAIVGNIRNVNNSEDKVVGYFGLADIKKIRYWVDRATATAPLAYLIGHKPMEEPPPPPPASVPSAPCQKSATRTNVTPEGWK